MARPLMPHERKAVRIVAVQPKFAPLPQEIARLRSSQTTRMAAKPAAFKPVIRVAAVQHAFASLPNTYQKVGIPRPNIVSPPVQRKILPQAPPPHSFGIIQRDPVPTGLAYGVSASPTELSLIHRVDPAEGIAKDTVRVYLTVFAFSTSVYKDIHANGGGIKLIAKTADTMFNIGDPRRAFHYYNTYRAQAVPATCPIIRSFDIPKSLYDKATGQAISESQRAKLGKANAYNVDKERGQNQFGVHARLRDEIESAGRNLISYVESNQIAAVQSDPRNGTVMDVNMLRRQLGMPTEVLDFMAPLRGAHVVTTREEAGHGALLTRLYDDLDELLTVRSVALVVPSARSRAELKIAGRCVQTSPDYYGADIAPRVLSQNIQGKSLVELERFRDEIGRAATFSVIPQMVNEEYLQANARLHADNQLRGILLRLAADLTALIDVRSNKDHDHNRTSLELQISNKCFPASPVYYGTYVTKFVRRKNLSTLSLERLKAVRDEVSRAQTATGASQSADETYLRDATAFAATIRDKNNSLLSPWAARQQYRILRPAPVVEAPKKPKLTPEEIADRRDAAARRKLEKEQQLGKV